LGGCPIIGADCAEAVCSFVYCVLFTEGFEDVDVLLARCFVVLICVVIVVFLFEVWVVCVFVC
jgi:hypothetical protein